MKKSETSLRPWLVNKRWKFWHGSKFLLPCGSSQLLHRQMGQNGDSKYTFKEWQCGTHEEIFHFYDMEDSDWHFRNWQNPQIQGSITTWRFSTYFLCSAERHEHFNQSWLESRSVPQLSKLYEHPVLRRGKEAIPSILMKILEQMWMSSDPFTPNFFGPDFQRCETS